MKLAYKIVLMNLGIAVVVTLFLIAVTNTGTRASDVAFAFGIVCLGMGVLSILVGLILLFASKKEWGSGLLLSSAMLLVLSGISCGSGLSGMRF